MGVPKVRPDSLKEVPGQGRWQIYGLHLPDDVLKKVYSKNAQKILGLEADLHDSTS